MGGRFAPADALEVARVTALAEPPRSQFRQGLSYFPEQPGDMRANAANFGGFGDASTVLTDATVIGGTVATGGIGAGVGAVVLDLASAFSSGATRDKQRAARANYFGNLAINGNVAAAQVILGALVPNVSGNELPMWQTWLSQLQSSSQGQAVLAAARAAGPYWAVGSTDTVTDYPITKNFVNTWASQHPMSRVAPVLANLPGGSALPWLLGIGAVVGVLALRRR